MKILIAVLLSLTTMLAATALACGDSLYRVGKGVSYRTYSAPLPGNLLVFGTSEGARQLAEELAKTGHDVRLVGSEDELTAELGTGSYDIVIAPYSERNTAGATAASFLPIAMSENEERQAKESFGQAMVPQKHELRHYLRAIHKTLKSRT